MYIVVLPMLQGERGRFITLIRNLRSRRQKNSFAQIKTTVVNTFGLAEIHLDPNSNNYAEFTSSIHMRFAPAMKRFEGVLLQYIHMTLGYIKLHSIHDPHLQSVLVTSCARRCLSTAQVC